MRVSVPLYAFLSVCLSVCLCVCVCVCVCAVAGPVTGYGEGTKHEICRATFGGHSYGDLKGHLLGGGVCGDMTPSSPFSGISGESHYNIPPFVTARKRSLGQGNIFIGMCQEFCSQVGVSAPRGCLLQEGVCSRGCVCSGGGVCSRGSGSRGGPGPGGSGPRGPGGDTPRTVTAAGGTQPTGMHSCFI